MNNKNIPPLGGRELNIIIIEDEKPAARLLQRKVEKLGLQVNILLHSVEETIAWFNNNRHPDLIFLDIQLSDGLSFEIFEQIDIKSAVGDFSKVFPHESSIEAQNQALHKADVMCSCVECGREMDEMEHNYGTDEMLCCIQCYNEAQGSNCT